MDDALLLLAIKEVPAIIARFQELRQQQDPDAPPLPEGEVARIYQAAFQSSLAKDDFWLSQHPEV